jgi:hypothetical protein
MQGVNMLKQVPDDAVLQTPGWGTWAAFERSPVDILPCLLKALRGRLKPQSLLARSPSVSRSSQGMPQDRTRAQRGRSCFSLRATSQTEPECENACMVGLVCSEHTVCLCLTIRRYSCETGGEDGWMHEVPFSWLLGSCNSARGRSRDKCQP